MLKRLEYAIVRMLTAALAALCAVACVNDRYTDCPDIEADPGVGLMLSLQLPSLPVESRAGAVSLPAEHIRELRVVVVSLPVDSRGRAVSGEEAVVEANRLIVSPQFNVMGQTELLFTDIVPDRLKRIYFLANCERAGSAYLDIADGEGRALDVALDESFLPAAGGRAPVDDCLFSAPTGRYGDARVEGGSQAIADYCVPVTAVHDIPVPARTELQTAGGLSQQLVCHIEKPLYLVRAVNKIDITISNETGSSESDAIAPTEVRLKSYSISQINRGRSYLLPHLNTESTLFDDYRPSADEMSRPVFERSDINPAWMRWLADEAAKSQSDSYVGSYRWLTDYYMPETARNGDTLMQSFFTSTSEAADGWLSSVRAAVRPYPTEWSAPTVYFPETLYIPDGGQKQEYVITCTFERRDVGGSQSETVEFSAVLPQLESLFRNTHVKVNLRVTDNIDALLTLVVQPWYTAPEEEWNYQHTVGIAANGFLTWDAETVGNDNKTDCRVVLKTDGTAAVGQFTISSPVNDEWYAYLIPLTGDPDAFCFVDEQGSALGGAGELVAVPHGFIDGTTPAEIRIRPRSLMVAEQNTAKLQIMVHTADNRYLEADVCNGEPTYYTIIQNRNSF